ncbi:putative bifunctional diguanylate cyclase/phosphodiesterase [Psychromonas sp. L1A2]|uniref:putative bifunctional diguanylate cyclase/phosphodiesterase n=1 Tax=Psychromonas sp. L1A2 TaxID=2686356 RepID=UPI001358DD5B|nr:GGDEF domain-containing response regulator [Psychromonas sp. L1A2]
MNILIVDDDKIDREMIVRALTRSNILCNITQVDMVDRALEVLAHTAFDVVLLDYNLPQRNGIELLIELKDMPAKENTVVIMTSTSKEDDLATSSINAGAQDFLVKTEINAFRLQRAIANAQVRASLEQELLRSHQRTKELAERDNLTGLANRYYFDESLCHEIKKQQRDKSKLALLLIDLDYFKFVNDNYGHDIGDQLLIAVTKRITSCLRGSELFARLGGDEFAITLTNLESAFGASTVAKRIIESLQKPFEIGHHVITSGASIGISLCPSDSTDVKELFKYADIAMYRSKSDGRNQFCFFEAKMQETFLENFLIENQLRSALTNDEFYLLYQPVISTLNGKITGVEALIRFEIEDITQRPDIFIPIAEKSRLIIEIGRWVIAEAIKQLSYWQKIQGSTLTMSINLSSIQLSDEGLIESIESTLIKHGVNASHIEFELTETALLVEQENTTKMIQSISDLGCKISLDDFGTGFSSISHLHRFPINTVKVDKSLMPSALPKENTKPFLAGLVVMIQSLELDIIAEGIETEIDLNLCIELGVNKMQGYYFDKPLTVHELESRYL